MSKLYSGLMSPIETLDALVLTAGNNKFRQDVDAEFIVIEAADEAVDVYLNRSNRPIKMSANDFFRMPTVDGIQTRFTQIEIRRRAGASLGSNTVVISVGTGEYRRGSVTVAANVKVSSASTLATPADVVLVAATNTLLFPANANAVRRRIRNQSGTDSVRISSSAASLTAGAGELLGPGEGTETVVTGEIYARSAGTPTLNLSEETF